MKPKGVDKMRVIKTNADHVNEFAFLLTKEEHAQYHYVALPFFKEGDVVMWTQFVDDTYGHQPGVHDGLRDGFSSGRARKCCKFYTPVKDWLAAGNNLPD